MHFVQLKGLTSSEGMEDVGGVGFDGSEGKEGSIGCGVILLMARIMNVPSIATQV
jgi:hypothetical protein